MFAAGCIGTTDQTAKINDTVNIYYTLTLEDGTVYQTNIGKEPLNFVLGSGQVIKEFDDAIISMKPKETKIVTLTPDQAYGTYNYDTYTDIPISLAETYNNGSISIGSIFLMCDYSTSMMRVVQGEVMAIDNESNMARVVINHPLAGKTLIFEIKLDSIDEENK
jgi:peptidylprolyl isomerase